MKIGVASPRAGRAAAFVILVATNKRIAVLTNEIAFIVHAAGVGQKPPVAERGTICQNAG